MSQKTDKMLAEMFIKWIEFTDQQKQEIIQAIAASSIADNDDAAKMKVGDKVKIKTSGLTRQTERGHKKYIGKSGKVVKDYGDGDLKVNFGGNDDRSVDSKDLVKEEVEIDGKASFIRCIQSLADKRGGKEVIDYFLLNDSYTIEDEEIVDIVSWRRV